MKLKVVTLFKAVAGPGGFGLESCDFKETPKYFKPLGRKPGFLMAQVAKGQLEWEGLSFTPEGAIQIKLDGVKSRKAELMNRLKAATEKEGQLEKLLDKAAHEIISGNSGTFLVANLGKEGGLESVLARYEKKYGGMPGIARVNDKGKEVALAALQKCGITEIELNTAQSGGIFETEIWLETPGES